MHALRYEYCIACEVDWHEDQTCAQYQEWRAANAQGDAAYRQLLAQDQARTCPRCRNAAVKISGCDSVVCHKCRHSFSYSQAPLAVQTVQQ